MKRMQIIIMLGVFVLGVGLGMLLVPKSTGSKKGKPRRVSFLKDADVALDGGNLEEAKALYRKAMETTKDVNKLKRIQDKTAEINMRILFSPIIDECSTKYIVKPNDALAKIARKFNTTVNFIKRANSLTSDVIKPGQELKVHTCKFSLVVDKSQNLLFLERKGEIIRTYIVATGRDNGTPIGNFKIVNKLTNPTWYRTGAVIPPDSPDNILGSRWMGFDLKGYGIHGTTEPEALGKQLTLGCVRMKNEDIENLFDIIPMGTEVTIID